MSPMVFAQVTPSHTYAAPNSMLIDFSACSTIVLTYKRDGIVGSSNITIFPLLLCNSFLSSRITPSHASAAPTSMLISSSFNWNYSTLFICFHTQPSMPLSSFLHHLLSFKPGWQVIVSYHLSLKSLFKTPLIHKEVLLTAIADNMSLFYMRNAALAVLFTLLLTRMVCCYFLDLTFSPNPPSYLCSVLPQRQVHKPKCNQMICLVQAY